MRYKKKKIAKRRSELADEDDKRFAADKSINSRIFQFLRIMCMNYVTRQSFLDNNNNNNNAYFYVYAFSVRDEV